MEYPAIGQPAGPRQQLYRTVVQASQNLRGQLEALNQQRHYGADPDDVAAVQQAIFDRAHS